MRYLLVVFFGLALGAFTAIWATGFINSKSFFQGQEINVDGWVSDWSIGSKNANPYVRARVARRGLLALAKEEAIYFIRSQDDNGDQLTDGCRYKISGEEQQAYWWSITLYDAESRLPINTDNALSIDTTKASAFEVGEEGRWSAIIAPQKPDIKIGRAQESPLWMSSKNAGLFDVTLRLYQPERLVLEAPLDHINPPSITKLSCTQGVS